MLQIDQFKAQDVFTERMLRDHYEDGVLRDEVYEPYFKWKSGKAERISKEELWELKDKVSEDLDNMYNKYPDALSKATDRPIWGQYDGYGRDKYRVSYLEAIDGEIAALMMIFL